MGTDKQQHHGPLEEESPVGPRRLVSNFTPGGHEIDDPPSKALFGWLGITLVFLVLSSFGVYQLFVSDAATHARHAAKNPPIELVNQAARDAERYTTYGIVRDVEGKAIGFRMPIREARSLVLAEPTRFTAAAPPEGWVHPDDPAPTP